MTSRGDEEDMKESLSSSFQKILDINEELNNSSLPTNDPKYQAKVRDAIERLEKMTQNVNELGIFSANENIDEIPTEHLKYLLLPALLADFTMKDQQHDRIDVLETAEIYYRDYISRLNDYQICDIDLKNENEKDVEDNSSSRNQRSLEIDSLIKQAQARNSKITRYKQMKQLEEELGKLKQLIIDQQHNGLTVDEDVERSFYLKLIRRWLNQALDELGTIESEKPLVKMRAALLKQNSKNSDSVNNMARVAGDKHEKPKPLKPIILTKDRLQKQIYGAGYPSVPTYSVDEFVQQKIDDGSWKLDDKNIYSNSLYDWANNPDKKKQEEESEEEHKERLLEKDDMKELQRLRNWDDWKDDHKRGEGNRHNMG